MEFKIHKEYWLFFLISLVYTLGYGQNLTNDSELLSEFRQNSRLNNWLKGFGNPALNDFMYDGTVAFEGLVQDTIVPNNRNFKEYLEIYKPLISYSSDSSRFLDFYSDELSITRDGGMYELYRTVDQTLLLGDLKARVFTRIAFLGSTKRIEEAEWINADEFICVGTRYDGKYHIPFVYVGCLSSRSYQVFLPGNPGRNTKYISPKWDGIPVDSENC